MSLNNNNPQGTRALRQKQPNRMIIMKKTFLPALLAISFAIPTLAPVANASSIGHISAGRKYYFAARDLQPWSAGVYVKSGKRDIRQGSIDTTRFALYAGYDYFPWVTTFAKVGSNNTSIDTVVPTTDDEFNMELGFGQRFNIFHHEILDPDLFENRILVNAAWEFSTTQARRGNRDQDFRELQASVTLSLVNDVVGSKLYLPHSIGLFAGPTFSLIDTSGASTRNDFGVIAGLEVFLTKRVSFHASMEQIGSGSSSALFGMHLCL